MKTYNVKLEFENSEDKARILKTLDAQRMAFNVGSKLHYEPKHPFGSSKNSIVDLHKKFYANFRKRNPEVPSQIVIRAEQDILAAYRSIKSNKQKITSAPQKTALAMRLDKRIFTLKRQTLQLTAVGGKRVGCKFLAYPKVAELFGKFTYCDPLIFKRGDEYFLAVTFNTPELPVTSEKAIGVDLGINRTAAISDGRIIKSKSFNAKKRQIRHLKSCLKSKGTKSAKQHLKKVRRKERNINHAFVHSVANEILKTDASLIVVEDLKKLKRNIASKNANKGQYGKNQNNKLSQVGFSELRQILEYKAQALGKRVVTVSPYNTSQEDFRGISKGERKGSRYYASDKTVLDADLNAANNIVLKYPTKLPVTCRALDGQALVTEPIVCKSSTLGVAALQAPEFIPG